MVGVGTESRTKRVGRGPAVAMLLLSGFLVTAPETISAADQETGSLASLGFGQKKVSVAAAPLPPLPPAEPLSAGNGSETNAADQRPAAVTGSTTSRGRENQLSRQAAKASSGWWPLHVIGFGSKPPAQTPLKATPASPLRAEHRRSDIGFAAVSPIANGAPARRFDPDVNLADLLISDAQTVVGEAPSTPASPDRFGAVVGDSSAGNAQIVFDPAAEPEHSSSVSDEPISLVRWLSGHSSAMASDNGLGNCSDVSLQDRCCPTWAVQVDALFFWQGNIPSRPLYVETASQQTALDANQLQNKAAIAPRYAITYNRDECRAIEVNYFQAWGFDASQQISPQVDEQGNGVFTGINLAGLDLANTAGAVATSSAHIQSLEVNLRRRDDGIIQWISGFRWLEWGQNLSINDARIVDTQPLPTLDSLNVGTLNNLYGWQWGGDMMVWNAGRWLRINGVGKAGVYYNHQSAQSTSYTDFAQPITVLSASNDTVSFVGETGINCSWALTNWLSWRAGYSFFWLAGVASPVNQLSLTDLNAGTTSVNTNGSVFLQAATTGLEARW